jgi:hypothetical protein
VASNLPQKVIDQIARAGLPTGGEYPFKPRVKRNRQGEIEIDKKMIQKGKKRRKVGYVDDQGRIWIKDRSHAGLPDHWDVQLGGGEEYIRVDMNGNEIRPDRVDAEGDQSPPPPVEEAQP